jgi:Holliday junction resolvase RusA-like endonuclease
MAKYLHSLSITLPGKPVPKQRARKGAGGHWYNPSEDAMIRAQGYMRDQLPEGFKLIPKNIPVRVNVSWFFAPAKSEKVPNIESEQVPYLKKIDRDNLDKLVLDSGNKIIWADDSHCYAGDLVKFYPNNPRTEIFIVWEDENK